VTIRAIVFDCGNVLEISGDDYDVGRWAAIAGMGTDELGRRIAGVFDGAGVGTVTLAEVHARLGDALGIGAGQVNEIMEDLWRAYLGTPNTELTRWARTLRPRYAIGILSNSSVGAREREQAAYGYAEWVDDLVYSDEVGLLKPDPRIYALSCERLGVVPGDAVFVDDKEVNVAGARAAGMHAVHFAIEEPATTGEPAGEVPGAGAGERVRIANRRAIAEISALLSRL
jgi:FMN phosphatase YigB (HAD superfamily)